jgi:hypothetical protein
MRYGYSLPERLDFFKDLIANSQQNSISKWDVKVGGRMEQVDVFRVPLELPKYRLDNTRTLPLQEQYIYANSKPADFFSDVESDEAQKVQHELLKKVIKSNDSDKDLIRFFETNEQTEPLILTHDGFVVSGNRRLCTFRELASKFPLIRVAILPKLDDEQIDSIEDYLEQETDIKDPFSWIGRAMGYRRRMRKFKCSADQLSKKAGIAKSEITGLVDRLEIADRYLDSIGKPKDYDEVLKDDQAFMKIDTFKQKEKLNIPKRNAFEKLSFIALKKREMFTDRMYNNIPLVYEAQELIHDRIANEFAAELEAESASSNQTSQIPGLSVATDPAIALIKVIDVESREDRVAEIISDTILEVKQSKLDKKRASSVLTRVTRANTLLVEANTVKSHETDKKGVANQLDNLEAEIAKLRSWVNNA